VRVYLPDQDVREGAITIAVLEGRLGAVRVDHPQAGRHLSDEQVLAYMGARQKIGEPVRPDDVQRAVSLLNEMPGLSASSLLEPGDKEGESRLVVSVQDTPRYAGLAQIDNAGSKASGAERLTLGGTVNSPLGLGDQVQVLVNTSRGSTYGRAAYSLPVGHDGLRVGASASRLHYGYSLSGTRYTGGADVLGLTLNYPWLRSTAGKVNATFGHDRKRFDNAVAGIALNDKRLNLNTLGLDGEWFDEAFGGGITQFSLGLTLGRLDLGRNAGDLASDQIANGPDRQGRQRQPRFVGEVPRQRHLGGAGLFELGAQRRRRPAAEPGVAPSIRRRSVGGAVPRPRLADPRPHAQRRQPEPEPLHAGRQRRRRDLGQTQRRAGARQPGLAPRQQPDPQPGHRRRRRRHTAQPAPVRLRAQDLLSGPPALRPAHPPAPG